MPGRVWRLTRYIQSNLAGQNRYGADADWGCSRWGVHWRHLASTVEPSVCSGDAALCQITLTTCYRGYKPWLYASYVLCLLMCSCYEHFIYCF